MSYVRVTTVIIPPDMRQRFEEHYRGQADALRETDGLECFELLRPSDANDPYMVYTRWTTGAAFSRWQTGQEYDRAHSGGGGALAPLSEHNARTWSYEVIESVGVEAGPPPSA